MKRVIRIILSFCNQHIWVTFFAIRANRFIQKQIEVGEDTKTDVKLFTKKFDEAKKILEAFDKEHIDRKKILEEKARALLLIVTASITLTASILTYIYNLKESHNISLSILTIGYIYLIFCVIDVLTTLNTTEYYYIGKEQYFKPVEGTNELEFEDFDKTTEYLELLNRNVQLNAKKNLKKQNTLYAAFENLRNGVILICLFFILSIFQKMCETPEKAITFKTFYRVDSCGHHIMNAASKKIKEHKTLIIPAPYNYKDSGSIKDTSKKLIKKCNTHS